MAVLPETVERLTHMIQVFQQLQRLLPISATLSDVADLLACAEVEFGIECLLEDVIQRLVGEHLAIQIAQQQGTIRRYFRLELETPPRSGECALDIESHWESTDRSSYRASSHSSTFIDERKW